MAALYSSGNTHSESVSVASVNRTICESVIVKVLTERDWVYSVRLVVIRN